MVSVVLGVHNLVYRGPCAKTAFGRYIEFVAVLVYSSPQEAAVDRAVRALDLPKGVRLRSVSFDTDHSGDPAIYVSFSVSTQQGIGSASIRALGVLRQNVHDAMEQLYLDRLCYIRFVDVK